MSLAARMDELLRPGGRLAARWPRYEQREAQGAMARDVALTLERGGVLLAEAPTGVGKSLAYLLPSVLLALESEQRVVIATCTRSLQDQLVERDLPSLLSALEVSLPTARLKGKQNYLCPVSLDLADGRGEEESETLEQLRRWAASTDEGDLDRFEAQEPEAFRRLRPRVATDPVACTAVTCRRVRECFWARARRVAASARLLVVNHALLARATEADLMPAGDVLIVDEAHRLEGVLSSQLERSLSRHSFEEPLRLIGAGRAARSGATRGGGLLARVRGLALPLFERGVTGGQGDLLRDQLERLSSRIAETRTDAERLFAAVEPRGERHELYGARERYRSAAELFGRDLDPLECLLGHCTAFASGLARLAVAVESSGARSAGEELIAELQQVGARWTGLHLDLENLAEAAESSWVYWRSAGGRGIELHGAPISVAEAARRLVAGPTRAAVLTSATLSSGGDFAWIAGRLGLDESRGGAADTRSYPSPFPLARQMKAFVLDSEREESEAIASLVAELAGASARNQLVLFTAHERLRRARERLLELLPPSRRLLAQDWDGPAGLLADRFRAERGAILLGVQSLWEGVDFPGPALEILVVARLPFSVPTDPLVEARAERLRDAGLDPFRHDAVPEAVVRFRQGVGRLIRRLDDRGVLVVCDPRLLTASYRQPFLDALPVVPRRFAEPRALASEAAAFLSAGEVPVEDEA